MAISDKLNEAVKNRRPYINQLAWNLQLVLLEAKITLGGGYIYVDLFGPQDPDLKKWLFEILETLPEIEYPIERVNFVVRVDNAIELVTLINPSENDVRALDNAIGNELNFSKESDGSWNTSLPLDHPYYSDKSQSTNQ